MKHLLSRKISKKRDDVFGYGCYATCSGCSGCAGQCYTYCDNSCGGMCAGHCEASCTGFCHNFVF